MSIGSPILPTPEPLAVALTMFEEQNPAFRPTDPRHLGFYVIAPDRQIKAGVFGNLVTKESIYRKVAVYSLCQRFNPARVERAV